MGPLVLSEYISGFLEGLAGVGTAVLSVDIGTGSIHVNILFKGIVKEGELNVPFHVRFETTRDGETRILDETVVLETAGEVRINMHLEPRTNFLMIVLVLSTPPPSSWDINPSFDLLIRPLSQASCDH